MAKSLRISQKCCKTRGVMGKGREVMARITTDMEGAGKCQGKGICGSVFALEKLNL